MEKNVLIVCETGISAALLVSKFLQEVRNQNLKVDVDYAQMRKLQKKVNLQDYDIVVLTPQVARFETELKKSLNERDDDSSVLYMTSAEFNYMNVNSVLSRINEVTELEKDQ